MSRVSDVEQEDREFSALGPRHAHKDQMMPEAEAWVQGPKPEGCEARSPNCCTTPRSASAGRRPIPPSVTHYINYTAAAAGNRNNRMESPG